MQRDFICAYFGGDQSGITWTITARGFGSLKQAEKHGLYMMPMAGCFGFAVISEDQDAWILYDQFSMLPNNVSVGRDHLNNYNVTNAPKLEMVA
jgi:hypothetical protein|tara:strand:+ start:60 stop:341 length:282 start_codon:yes stop_codon:yes gene_type:complete